jgi:squalene/oxidosqualene cyclase-like protein
MNILNLHKPDRLETPARRALADLARRQQPSGAWEGEVIWCPMIAAQMAIARTVIGRPGDARWRAGLLRYLARQQNADGGWGLHPLSPSTLFVTTLCYTALRLLGEGPDMAPAAAALAWIRSHPEGVEAIPSWGKLWLAFLGLYPYEGITPIPPELFMLPRWSPLRADQLYCHTRYIYLGIAVLFGRRFSVDLGTLGLALRDELYDGRYAAIDFTRCRRRIAESDLYIAPGRLLRALFAAMAWSGAQRQRFTLLRGLRARALAHCLGLIRREVEASAAQCLSPVNGVLSLLALWSADPADPLVDRLVEGLEAWRWEDEEGVRYAGARSQGWDTAFALQALAAARSASPALAARLRAGYRWLRAAQLGPSPVPLNADRQAQEGGWCFSDGAHRWPVSDCTAEAVSALLDCHRIAGLIPATERIGEQRLTEAVRFILARQNADGGFGTYERRRGPAFLERFNPSEMFGQCMTELSYIECTASALQALSPIEAALPALAAQVDVRSACRRAVAFLRRSQRADGAWPGFWGINFLYATCFAMRGLAAAGLDPQDATLARAAAWVLSVQRGDGGWGEHFSGCREGRYVENDASLVSSTSWALLALLAVHGSEHPALARGLAWLAARQDEEGGWPREPVNGVFFGSAMLEYPLYTSTFPTLALALALAERRHG